MRGRYGGRDMKRLVLTCSLVLALASGALPARAETLPAVGPKRGVALFDAICGKNLPAFRNAERSAAVNGVDRRADTGTIYSGREDISFRLSDGPGAGKTCSIVFRSTASQSVIYSEAAKIASGRKITKSSIGDGGIYGDRALFLVQGPISSGGAKYYSLKMLSER